MRVFAAGIVAFAALGWTAAEASPDFPAGTEATEHALLGHLDAYWQNWVKEQARTMVSSGRISEERARSLAQGARLAAGADVDSVSFLLLMQAARDADADLQGTMDRSIQARAEQDELSTMAHNKAPTESQLSPETQTVLSMKAHTRPVMTWRSNDTGGATGTSAATPAADADPGVHVDLQTAMDREAAAEDALSVAAKRLPTATAATR
ncbi:MAG TPA: hypothetical protein VHW69_05480 [Rhizomicrobium sp.]|jgi:hypothetical protein|nr:hypothetical protein [Rhizomicrobium sp.]